MTDYQQIIPDDPQHHRYEKIGLYYRRSCQCDWCLEYDLRLDLSRKAYCICFIAEYKI